MNKLDFMSLGKKAVQAYIYKTYGIALGLRDLTMSSYTNNSEGQIGKYRIEPWAKDPNTVPKHLSSQLRIG